MDLKNYLQEKVDMLEYNRKLQQHYISNQFKIGRKKGYEDKQKIKLAVKNILSRLDYTRLGIACLLLSGAMPVLIITYSTKLIYLAAGTEIILGILGVIILTSQNHSHLNDKNKSEK